MLSYGLLGRAWACNPKWARKGIPVSAGRILQTDSYPWDYLWTVMERTVWRWLCQHDLVFCTQTWLDYRRIFPRSMMKNIKNRIVVSEKSTNKNRTFVLFSYLHLYTFKKMSDIIGTVTRTNSKNMTEPEPGIIRYFRVLFYPQKSVLWLLFVTRWKRHLFTIKMSFSLRIRIRIFGWYWS